MASDEAGVTASVRALQKAVQSKEPTANIIDILKTLEKDVKATEDLLRNTRAGVVVAKLRAGSDKEIASLATRIVTAWKAQISARKPQGAAAANAKAAAKTPSATTMPEVFNGDPLKRTWTTDKVNTKRTSSDVRNSCLGIVYNGLAFRSTEAPGAILIKAELIEEAAFKTFKGETPEYKSKMRSLFQNLKAASNVQLGLRVMSGDISPEGLVTMPQGDLVSDKRKEEDKKLALENMKKAQVPMAEKSISAVFKCGKCGQKKVSYSQAQTRSADEPMTTFCTCTVCGNRWKFS